MKGLRYSLLFGLLLFACFKLSAQVVITTLTVNSCDNSVVKFGLSPMNDSITDIVWFFGDGKSIAGIQDPEHSYEFPGNYNVSVRINSNSLIHLPQPLKIYNSPDASFEYNDTLVNTKKSFVFKNILQAGRSLNYSYEWHFPNGNVARSSKAVYAFPENGIYSVGLIVTDSRGCADTLIRSVNADVSLDVPNVFTPNEDGFNDYFEVTTNGSDLYEFLVYSRNGLLIYKSEAAVINWDGRSFSGNIVSPGLYFYVIRQMNGSSPDGKTGFVQIFY